MTETYLKPIFSVTMLAKFTLLVCYAITLDVLYVKLKQMLSRKFFQCRYNLFVLVLNEFFLWCISLSRFRSKVINLTFFKISINYFFTSNERDYTKFMCTAD